MNSISYDFEVAKEKAIKYIGISKKTQFEVKRKLSMLKFNEDIIQEVIDYITELRIYK